MIREYCIQLIPRKPADCDIYLGFTHQFTIMYDPLKETGEH